MQRSPTDVRGESPSGRVAAVRLQIECPGKQFPCAARGGKMLARSTRNSKKDMSRGMSSLPGGVLISGSVLKSGFGLALSAACFFRPH